MPLPFRDRPAGRRLLERLAPGDAVVVVSPLVLAPKLPRYSTLANALGEDWCPRRCRKAVEAAAAGRLPRLPTT